MRPSEIALILKNSKYGKFELKVLSTDTILEVKSKLLAEAPVFEPVVTSPSQLKFIFSGKILEDRHSVSRYKLANNNQIVVGISKKKVGNKIDNQEIKIKKIMEMGFTREEVTKALKTNSGSLDNAIDALTGEHEDLFAAVPINESANEEEEIRKLPSSIELAVEDLISLRQISCGEKEAVQPFLDDFCERYPDFREQITQNPDSFISMLLEVLGDDFQKELDEFEMQDMDAEDKAKPSDVGSSTSNLDPVTENIEEINGIEFTDDEENIISRLCELGFERTTVVQVYLACNKDEQIAANILFSDYSA